MRFSFWTGAGLAALQAGVVLALCDGWVAPDGWAVPSVPPPMAGPAAVPTALASRSAAPPPDPVPPQPHPFAAPICPEVTAAAVTEAPDFEWSLATLRAPTEAGNRATRFGGSVGARTVVYVGHNPWLGSPAVWLSDGTELCQSVLRQPPESSATVRRPVAVQPESTSAARALIRLVERVDLDTFRIDRRLLHLALGDAHELDPALHGVRGGVASDGFRFARVPANSLPAVLGLAAGDRVVEFNGRPLAGPAGVVAAYAQLQRGGPATLTVVRGGRTVRLRYTFD
jgi:hypothetical protein